MRRCVLSASLFVLSLLAPHAGPVAAAEEDRKGLDYFEAKIRPLLIKHCYECHSAGAAAKSNLKAALLLDTREGVRKGGDSGPAVVPGKPDESLLMDALKYDAFKMPPKGKLPDELISHFEKWIAMGAPDPREGSAIVAASEIDIVAGRKHWTFQPLRSPDPPEVESSWVRTPVDRFILARLKKAGVEPNGIASPRTLIRRAYFDLIGLPPEPQVVEQFVREWESDPEPAYAKLVDDLLENPSFGERWARHWLDIVRFAESNGYAFDGDRPNAWRYRDFVIQALNSDMPYDEFVRMQIAGDLLTNANANTKDEAEGALHALSATGFLVAGPYTTQQTQKERERSRYEQLDDILNTMGTSLLGLTLGCSRCHSHKYDPLPQYDYYRLASCFADVGFSDTGVNMEPEQFRDAKAKYDASHQPLVAARTKHEQEQLPQRFAHWLAAAREDGPAATADLKSDVWHHAGPFPAESFEKAFSAAFPPEQSVDLTATYLDGKVHWMKQPEWKDGVVHNTLTGENSANYLYRVIQSPESQTVSLSLGRDDAIKVWVNGAELVSKQVTGGVVAGQDVVQADLNAGRNEVLIKIVNASGPSGFYFSATPVRAVAIEQPGVWRHIGPFQAANFNVAFDQAFSPERDTDPQATYEDGKLKWVERPEWKDGVAHNDKLGGTNCANYLFREVISERPQVASFSLGSDDGVKLWVNGREVLSKKVTRNAAAAGQETVVVQLAAGKNEILMKVVNAGGATGFYFAASGASAPKAIADILAVAEEKRNADQKKKLTEWHRGYDVDWLRLNRAVIEHAKLEPKPNLTQVFSAKVRGTTYQFGGDTYKVYHLRRGNADNKQDLAKPGFLQVLMRSDDEESRWLARGEASEPPRVGLANWLADVEHGAGHVLARVIVNRLWHHHFGRGIVATPSDFGTRGETPSHPELLDWLASELVRNQWKLKPIHRLILTSSVYMQGGQTSSGGQQHDPENLLLWRREAKRLEAEVIRDSLLAVSGTLDKTMFGKGTLDQKSRRRSIYFTVKRSQLIPLLQLFDAPDTMQGIATREESTVAPQALALLNSPVIRDLATQLAARIRPNQDTSLSAAIEQAYSVVLSRPPTQSELAEMLKFVELQQAARAGANSESLAVRDFCHLLLCTNEFVYID